MSRAAMREAVAAVPVRGSKAEWMSVRFDQMAENVVDRVHPRDAKTEYYIGLEHLDSDSLKIQRWGTPDEVDSTKFRFRRGDIIFGKRRSYQRKLGVAEFDGICSAHAMVLRAKEDVIAKEFLPVFMQSDLFMERALAISVGSLSPTINWKTLARQEFRLPPIHEQRRIAEILWAASEEINALDAILAALNFGRKVLVGESTARGKRKGWRLRRLVDCFTIVSGQVKPTEEPYRSMPLVAPNHIEQGTGRLLGIETSAQQNAISGKYLFKPGDVIYSKIRPNLRKATLVDFQGVCSADMYAFRAIPEIVIPSYLIALILGDDFSEFAESRSVRTGIPKINREELGEYEVMIPPINEQRSICEVLRKFDTCDRRVNSQISETKKLKTHLINQLFASNGI